MHESQQFMVNIWAILVQNFTKYYLLRCEIRVIPLINLPFLSILADDYWRIILRFDMIVEYVSDSRTIHKNTGVYNQTSKILVPSYVYKVVTYGTSVVGAYSMQWTTIYGQRIVFPPPDLNEFEKNVHRSFRNLLIRDIHLIDSPEYQNSELACAGWRLSLRLHDI
jgi:hypothetical protein